MQLRYLIAAFCLISLLVSSASGVGEERFYGGPYDGYAGALYLQSDSVEFASRFSGGAHDGYAEGALLQSDPVEFSSRFSGGAYDGYAEGVLLQSNPLEFSARFSGGAYDGYADATAANQPSPLMLDSDGDQLIDWWELIYAGDLALLSGSGDYDGDGATDLHEMIADTIPTDSNDWFHITAISNSSLITVYFVSSSNRWYGLYERASLLTGEWSRVSEKMGVGGVDTLVDTNATVKGFYRLSVEIP